MRAAYVDLASQPISNFALSPKCETANTNWSSNTAIAGSQGRVAVTDLPGASWAYSIQVAATSTAGRLFAYTDVLRAGAVYTAALWIKSDVGSVWTTRALAKDGSLAYNTSVQYTMTGKWQRISSTFTAPADADAPARVEVKHSVVSAADQTVLATMLTVTPGSTPPPTYVDGDTPGWKWTGATGVSASVGYPYTLESIAGGPLAVANTVTPTVVIPDLDPFAGRTLYAVYDSPDITANYPALCAAQANGGSPATTGVYRFQFQAANINSLGSRVDTASGQVNSAIGIQTSENTRGPGRHVASLALPQGMGSQALRADNSATVRIAVAPGNGMNWPTGAGRLVLTTATPSNGLAAYVFAGEHGDTTARQVMAWLARQYGATPPTGY